MAIFQPSQIVPDVRSGIGLGVIDATKDMKVSWRITGTSALASYSITIYTNDSASTQKYTTGQITTGCPAYGVTSTGAIQFFSYTIGAAALSTAGITNGNEYKLVIKQWWSANDSVTQSSASVFVTRAAPTLTISAIGTAGVIATRNYTFTGNYSQTQGDVLNWFRWRIAGKDGSGVFFDSGNVSGTMQLSCAYDGFLPDKDYSVRLNVQTESGVEADTDWVNFSADYPIVTISDGSLLAGCVGGTDAVLVQWDEIGYIPGTATGDYEISEDAILYLPSGSKIAWSVQGAQTLDFAPTWGVVWKGTLRYADAEIFKMTQANGDIALQYSASSKTLTLKKGSTTLTSQSGIPGAANVTAILSDDTLSIRCEYLSGGLYPSTTLYPSSTLYPNAESTTVADTYSLSVTYTQEDITGVEIGGLQYCDYLEIINGEVSAQTITQAITYGTYVPALNQADYFYASWINGLYAGTLDLGGDTIIGYTLYRGKADESNLVRIAETGPEISRIFDYSALSQQGPYTYYLFPTGQNTYISTPVVSGMVMPCWWNWTLMECEETERENEFLVKAAYRFRLNVETGDITNNNSPAILQNFTRYPKVQSVPQNYKSGSLTGLIGAIDWNSGQPEYVDTTELRDAIFQLSVTQNPLFLKTRKGELIRIRVSGAISMQTADATREQMQTMTLPWVEIGDASGVSLYSKEYAGVQETEGAFVPQFYVDASDATADANNLRIEKTAYNKDGKIVGDAKVQIVDGSLIMPEGMEV